MTRTTSARCQASLFVSLGYHVEQLSTHKLLDWIQIARPHSGDVLIVYNNPMGWTSETLDHNVIEGRALRKLGESGSRIRFRTHRCTISWTKLSFTQINAWPSISPPSSSSATPSLHRAQKNPEKVLEHQTTLGIMTPIEIRSMKQLKQNRTSILAASEWYVR